MQTTDIRKLPQDAMTSAHRIWLAGLGAFALVEESTTQWLDELGKRGRDLEKKSRKQYEQLVARGRKIEAEGRKQATKARQRAEARIDDLQGEVDERMTGVLQRLGIPHSEQIKTLSRRVEELTHKVEDYQRSAGLAPVVAAAPERRVLHVVPHESGWGVKVEGTEGLTSTHGTKDEALTTGRELAQKREPSQLVVHRADGTIQTSYSYGG